MFLSPAPLLRPNAVAGLLLGWLLATSSSGAIASKGGEMLPRPNFLIIVADDLGFSDLGLAGSEIATPNIDRLARSGVLLTNFYVAPTCSPTRSMLMSGADHHRVGLGVMHEVMNDTVRGRPGYEGYLNDSVVTLPQRLQEQGYHTYMAGKWHLGLTELQSARARGFERSFTLLGGGASHFSDQAGLFADANVASYREDGKLLKQLPEDFFSSTFYADRMMDYIGSNLGDGKPFFGYLAFTAPHWPLHAPEDYIDRYRGTYDAGWDVWRDRRLGYMRGAGLVPEGATTPPRMDRVKPWDSLSLYEKQHFSRRMEIYAAMIEHMDAQIGRVLDYLDKAGQLDNTYIMFFSDNGPEGNDANDIFDNYLWVPGTFDNSLENMGRSGSYVSQGTGWAQVSAVPYRLFKSFPSEGGVRVPGIVSFGGRVDAGSRRDEVLSVMDVAPTVLELAGAGETAYPGKVAMAGSSFASLLNGKGAEAGQGERVLGWELFGRAALRRGDWKVLRLWEPFGSGRWELFNLEDDPAEAHDLAESHPQKLESLVDMWHDYARSNGVFVIEQDTGYAR